MFKRLKFSNDHKQIVESDDPEGNNKKHIISILLYMHKKNYYFGIKHTMRQSQSFKFGQMTLGWTFFQSVQGQCALETSTYISVWIHIESAQNYLSKVLEGFKSAQNVYLT